jgi:hypothetical protein
MPLLTSLEYPSIRAAIDISLDATVLPDSIIGLPIYADAAEQDVLRRDPTAEDRTGVELQHVTNAAIYLCAALLVPAVPQISGETTSGQHSYTRKLVDVDDLAATLRARADAELAAVLTPSTPPSSASRPTLFGLASGRRGR